MRLTERQSPRSDVPRSALRELLPPYDIYKVIYLVLRFQLIRIPLCVLLLLLPWICVSALVESFYTECRLFLYTFNGIHVRAKRLSGGVSE